MKLFWSLKIYAPGKTEALQIFAIQVDIENLEKKDISK